MTLRRLFCHFRHSDVPIVQDRIGHVARLVNLHVFGDRDIEISRRDQFVFAGALSLRQALQPGQLLFGGHLLEVKLVARFSGGQSHDGILLSVVTATNAPDHSVGRALLLVFVNVAEPFRGFRTVVADAQRSV